MADRNAELVALYRTAAIEAAIYTRINVWENLLFEDLTPTVRATIAKIEWAIQTARGSIITVLSKDENVNQEEISRIAREKIVPVIAKDGEAHA